MHVCNMRKYGGLLADDLVLGNHVLTGLLPPVPVVQHHILALGDDGIQLLVSEVAVVVLDPGGELVPVKVQAQYHAFAGDVDLISAGTLPHLQQLVVLVPQGRVELGLQVSLPTHLYLTCTNTVYAVEHVTSSPFTHMCSITCMYNFVLAPPPQSQPPGVQRYCLPWPWLGQASPSQVSK